MHGENPFRMVAKHIRPPERPGDVAASALQFRSHAAVEYAKASEIELIE